MEEIEIKNTSELVNYESSLKFMKSRVETIQQNNERELLWFLNHDHIYTQGTSANNDEIIKLNNVKLIRTNRGGKTTYHGPGQRIIYFLINLNKRKKDIRRFVTIIEESLISFLSNQNIEARSYKDRVGIWVLKSKNVNFEKERKIGAIGIRVSKWVTYHGLSFNINPDMNYYKNIHACGLKGYENTSLKELGIDISQDEFDNEYKKIFLNKISNI
tara:strand:- start:1043 stop:1690 length:648 start_codon:yes stop_codon:yes gene_type:complete